MGDLWIDAVVYFSFQQASIETVDASNRLYNRSDSSILSVIGNCFIANLDGAKIFAGIVELYLATGTRESLPAKQPNAHLNYFNWFRHRINMHVVFRSINFIEPCFFIREWESIEHGDVRYTIQSTRRSVTTS